eukprot:4486130-Amphidinium_carterae.1
MAAWRRQSGTVNDLLRLHMQAISCCCTKEARHKMPQTNDCGAGWPPTMPSWLEQRIHKNKMPSGLRFAACKLPTGKGQQHTKES